MADDDMEISSEHGHNDADEDIDIDLDFAAGHADEDHIIEDVGHETMDNDLQLPPPLTDVYDEEMADEDHHSYQMDDADLLHDEEAPNADVESISLGADALVDTEDYASISSSKAEAFEHYGNFDLGPLNDAGQEALLNDPDVVGHETEYEALQHGNEDGPLVGEEAIGASQNNSAYTTPRNQSILDAPVVEEPRSPVSILNPGATFPENEDGTSYVDPKATDQIVSVDLDSAVGSETLVDQSLSPAIPNAIVGWDGKDYPLFSTSASDNPDTYFLSDTFILDEPLPKFFEAIREVIQGDLGEEDELVFSIDDLGLEASETSTSIQSLSLAQIFDLRQQLLKNERDSDQTEQTEEFHDQFYISVTVKKNFLTRLSNLIKGAAEGKRMSDFWEQRTHSLLELGDDDENQFDNESKFESLLSDNAYDEEDNNRYEDPEDTEHNPQIEQSSTNQESRPPFSSTPRDVEELGIDKVATASNGDVSVAKDAQTEAKIDSSSGQKVPFGEVNEDDLLDYSDDELGFGDEKNTHSKSAADIDRLDEGIHDNFISPPCVRPQRCVCPKCLDIFLADYDQINETLLNRSLSRRSSEEQITQPELLVDNTTDKVRIEQEGFAQDEFGDVDYNEETENHVGKAEADLYQYDHEDDAPESHVLDEPQTYNANYEIELSGEGVFAEDPGFELSNELGEYTDLLEEGGSFAAELGMENESHFEVPPQSLADIVSTNVVDLPGESKDGEVSDLTTNSASGSVAFPDTAESSVTLGADEIQYEDGQDEEALDFSIPPESALSSEDAKVEPLEQRDEIDYEDDEEVEEERLEVIPSGHSPPEMKESSPFGKRSIAQVDFDGVLDTRSNTAKRPRP